MKEVNDKFDKLYADFIEITLHLEERFYPHLLTTIFGRRWLLTYGMELAITKCLHSPEYISALGVAIGKAIEKGMQDGLAAGIMHSKEGRELTDVVTHNPSAKVDYVSALQQLQDVNFSLLADLKSNKDASVETVMNILRLEDLLAEKLGLSKLQPRVDQLMVPIHRSPDQVVLGASALLLALDVSSSRALKALLIVIPATVDTTTTLSITFAFANIIAPISVYDYEVMGMDDMACYFSILALLFALRIAASSLRYSKRSRLIPKASLFYTKSTFAILSVGMPISAGMTTSVPYVNENGVSLLLDFIMVCELDSLGTLLLVPLHLYAW
ncbi:hypothetical protein Tco_0939875 [Tanacetum coccineum]|uniref:Uncharacterized protein n=1 Tax=Tanacetum coccineum TaxID=301880 RepID=A0ABQ5DLC3_9ASTR